MSELEYEPWGEIHYCPTPPMDRTGAALKVGTEWACPECATVHVVTQIDVTGRSWISFGVKREEA